MKFEYKIKNLALINEANIKIAPFTLIAGKNNTGKSFVTKSLYCILEALNDDYVYSKLFKLLNLIKDEFYIFSSQVDKPAKIDIEFFEYFEKDFLVNLEYLVKKIKQDERININSFSSEVEKIKLYYNRRKNIKKFSNIIIHIEKIISILDGIISILNEPERVIIREIDKNLNINFKKNFIITSLNELLDNKKNSKLSLKIENIGEVIISDNKIGFSFFRDGVEKIQKLSNVIYIDSPVYTKLKKVLKREYLFDENYLKNYPLYIDKFYDFLEKRYIGEAEFKKLSIKIQKIIKGKLEIDSFKNINYISKNGLFPIYLTAMGITNIGIIDMLIRNNVINKGSFLIIDEPEVHLHPEWQVEFVKILYEIAKAGANVVITTHSMDIVKTVEVLAKEDKENIAINKMPFSKDFNEKNTQEKISEILEELGSPFYELYFEGL